MAFASMNIHFRFEMGYTGRRDVRQSPLPDRISSDSLRIFTLSDIGRVTSPIENLLQMEVYAS
jgi:hypothetical protein